MLDLSRVWCELTHDRICSDSIQAFLHALGCPLTSRTPIYVCNRLLGGVEAGGLGEFRNIAVASLGLGQIVWHFLRGLLQRSQLADFPQLKQRVKRLVSRLRVGDLDYLPKSEVILKSLILSFGCKAELARFIAA